MTRIRPKLSAAAGLLLLFVLASCGGGDPGDPAAEERGGVSADAGGAGTGGAGGPSAPGAGDPAAAASVYWSEVKVHEAIRAANPGYSGNGRFQIDEGGQVFAVELDKCGVNDLAPFSGMPLMALYLEGCPVASVEPLRGMPLVELYLENSAVTDLTPLENTRLQRLHIGETAVTDLTPLRGLPLTRLVFEPERIEKGMESLKAIATLQELGTKFEEGLNDLRPPAVFWAERGGES